jgi:DNA-binding beta-propeller fold protein YncE
VIGRPVICAAIAILALATPTPVDARVGLGQPADCVVQGRDRPPTCGPGFGLLAASAIAATPDGTGLYAVGRDSSGVAALARDPITGLLRWTSCVSDDGTDGTFASDGRCGDGDVLRGPSDVDVSTDGRYVYVTSPRASAIAVLARNPATGALTAAGCLANSLSDSRCRDAAAMRAPRQLALSPDGRFAYVTASSSSAVDVLARDPDSGALTWSSCVSNDGTDGTCVDGAALRGASGVVVSPDGSNVYVAAPTSGAIAVFARDAMTGALRQTGCVLHAAPVGVCTASDPLQGVSRIAISADGSTLISVGRGGVAAFAREPATGALHRTGCLGGAGCRALTTVNRAVAALVSADGRRILLADQGTGTVTLVLNEPTGLREVSCLRGRYSFGPGTCVEHGTLDRPIALDSSPDGRFVYAAAADGVVSLREGEGW